MARARKGVYRAEKRRKELKRLAKREAKRKKQVGKGSDDEENIQDKEPDGDVAD